MRRKSIIALVFTLSFFLCTSVLVGPTLAKTYKIKLGHPAGVEEGVHQGAMVMKSFVENQSQGRIMMTIYPAEQTGGKREQLEAVQMGAQEMTLTTGGGAAQMFPQIMVTDLPYAFPSDRVTETVYNGWFTQRLRDYCFTIAPTVRLLGVSNSGNWRGFTNTKREIRTPSDLKGLKIRTIMSPIQMKLVEALGGNPTPIAWQELYTSLSTGVVDGLKNNISNIIAMKFHESVKYLTLDNHTYIAAFWWINNDFWKSLPDDLQGIMLDGMFHLKQVASGVYKKQEVEGYDKFRKAGGKVYAPTPDEMAQFVAAAKPVREWFVREYGRDWVDLLEKAIADAKDEVITENLLIKK